jgi:hypothetical protein
MRTENVRCGLDQVVTDTGVAAAVGVLKLWVGVKTAPALALSNALVAAGAEGERWIFSADRWWRDNCLVAGVGDRPIQHRLPHHIDLLFRHVHLNIGSQ